MIFLTMIEKISKRRLKKEIFIIEKNIDLKIGLLLVISENLLSTTRKHNILTTRISY